MSKNKKNDINLLSHLPVLRRKKLRLIHVVFFVVVCFFFVINSNRNAAQEVANLKSAVAIKKKKVMRDQQAYNKKIKGLVSLSLPKSISEIFDSFLKNFSYFKQDDIQLSYFDLGVNNRFILMGYAKSKSSVYHLINQIIPNYRNAKIICVKKRNEMLTDTSLKTLYGNLNVMRTQGNKTTKSTRSSRYRRRSSNKPQDPTLEKSSLCSYALIRSFLPNISEKNIFNPFSVNQRVRFRRRSQVESNKLKSMFNDKVTKITRFFPYYGFIITNGTVLSKKTLLTILDYNRDVE